MVAGSILLEPVGCFAVKLLSAPVLGGWWLSRHCLAAVGYLIVSRMVLAADFNLQTVLGSMESASWREFRSLTGFQHVDSALGPSFENGRRWEGRLLLPLIRASFVGKVLVSVYKVVCEWECLSYCADFLDTR